MNIEEGDIIKLTQSGGFWVGLVIELLHGGDVARVWRPGFGIQTWPVHEHTPYQIEKCR